MTARLTTQEAQTLAAAFDARPTLWSAYKAQRVNRRQRPAGALMSARLALEDFKARAFAYETAAARRDQARADHEAAPSDATRMALRRAESARKSAASALAIARGNAMPMPGRARPGLSHGDVIRARDQHGRKRSFVLVEMPDYDMGAPWLEHDGHGPVRPRGRGDKRPGEWPLGQDWFYDFAAACKQARAEGWGFLPGPLELALDHNKPDGSRRGGWAICRAAALAVYDPADHNKAIAEVYARFRRTMSARQYAAEAARRDFERLAAWCNDSWCWAGLGLVELERDGKARNAQSVADAVAGGHGRGLGYHLAASLWGIESDFDADLAADVVADLLAEAMAN